MKKTIAYLLAVVEALALTGCGKMTYPDLPDDAIPFEMGTLVDASHDQASYGTIEYAGRTYIGYGTLGKGLHKGDIDRCIGYIVMDENSSSITDPDDTSVRIYTLSCDPGHNYLMDRDTAANLMTQPSFWRATDTQGADIPTPDFIQALEYSFWE